jgi:predicted Zn-dependent protease
MTLDHSHVEAIFFDGDRPVGQPVHVKVSGGLLQIVFEDQRVTEWPLDDLRLVTDGYGRSGSMLRCEGDPVARVYVRSRLHLPRLPNLWRPARRTDRGRLVKWAVAAVAAVAVQIGLLIPLLADNLAGFIPPEGERALGEMTFSQIREALDESGLSQVPICEAPAGIAALNRAVDRLGNDQGFRNQLSVFVLDHDMVNAFALPGGFVVLFRGLIDAADGPDEVMGVLAHEIGHVVSRDPTRHALRSAGSIGVLGLLLGDFAGGAAVLFLTERLISAQYSQQAEAEADAFALDLLEQAGINPGALGDMFATFRDRYGDNDSVTAYFMNHPALADRIAAARAVENPDVSYKPSMSPEDWEAFQQICG